MTLLVAGDAERAVELAEDLVDCAFLQFIMARALVANQTLARDFFDLSDINVEKPNG